MNRSTASMGARGGAAALGGQAARMIIRFLGVIILSRLLSPDDFGLFAMIGVFVVLGEVLRDFGMPTAALQAKTLTRDQASNLFWINSLLGLLVAGLLVATTPLLVLLYSEPRLGDLIPVAALSLFIGSVSAQFQVQIARAMRFGSNALIEVSAQFIGLAVGIAAALLGAGYWSLIWLELAVAASLLLLRAVVSRWLPSLPKRRVGTRALSVSGTHFGFSATLTFLANNADTLLLGVLYNPASVGYYNRAFNLLTIPVRALLSPLTSVVVPTVTRAAAEGASIERILARVQAGLGLAIGGLFVIMSASADRLLPLVLGPQWGPAIPIFQLLAIGGIAAAYSNVAFWGFVLHAKPKQLLYCNLITKVLVIGLVAVGASVSLEAVALAYSIGLLLSWPVELIVLYRAAGQSPRPFLASGARIFIAAALSFGCARLAAPFLVDLNDLVAMLGLMAVAGLAFLGIMSALPGGRSDMSAALTAALVLRRRR